MKIGNACGRKPYAAVTFDSHAWYCLLAAGAYWITPALRTCIGRRNAPIRHAADEQRWHFVKAASGFLAQAPHRASSPPYERRAECSAWSSLATVFAEQRSGSSARHAPVDYPSLGRCRCLLEGTRATIRSTGDRPDSRIATISLGHEFRFPPRSDVHPTPDSDRISMHRPPPDRKMNCGASQTLPLSIERLGSTKLFARPFRRKPITCDL